jgi:hypothetical protein
MTSRTFKKLLLSLMVIGVLGCFVGRGTYAVFNTETQNPESQLATGTLVLDDSVYGGAQQPCTSQSSGVGNSNTGCDTMFSSGLLFPVTSATPVTPPPASASTANYYAYGDVTIKNAGTLPATLSIYMPSCNATPTTSSPSSYTWTVINPCCPGSAYPCLDGKQGSLDMFIQEYSGGLPAPEGTGTALSSCIWPVPSPQAACTWTDDSLGDFNSQHHDNSHYLSLGSIAGGASRYFRIAVAEPIDAGNGLQGQTATFTIHWHLQ